MTDRIGAATAADQALLRALGRRDFLRAAGALAVSLGMGGLAACSSSSQGSDATTTTGSSTTGSAGSVAASTGAGSGQATDAASAPPDLDKAKQEGLVLWHANDESAKTEFLKGFTAATGVQATSERVLPGTAMPKLQQQYQANLPPSCDVYDGSAVGMMYTLQTQGQLMQYVSKELEQYGPPYTSNPKGFWTTYFVSPLPITYRTDTLAEADAPKSYEDLLDPKWHSQMGFQDASGGASFTTWYELRLLLQPDYFEQLAKNEPRSYSSSTQIATDLNSGVILLAPGSSMYQSYLALKQGLPYKIVLTDPGTPTNNLPTGILANCEHPNAAKAYTDYLLSREGQQSWTDILGSYSARSDVTAPAGLPALQDVKPLSTASADPAAAGTPEINAEFTTTWNTLLGVL